MKDNLRYREQINQALELKKKYGQLSAVFLQRKLKISFEQANFLIKECVKIYSKINLI